MAKTDTRERAYAGAATGEEGKFFAALQQLVPSTDTIKGVSFRFRGQFRGRARSVDYH